MPNTNPITNYRDIRFDGQGRPFNVTQNGQPSYLTPSQAAQAAGFFIPDAAQRQAVLTESGMSAETVQRLVAYAQQHKVTAADPNGDTPTNTFARQNNGWNSQTGQFDQGMNWGGLGGAILGGAAVAGPLAIGPAIAGATGGAAGSTVAPGVVNLATPASTAAAAPYAAAAGGSSAAATSAGATGGWQALKHSFDSPADLAKLIPLLPAIRAAAGGGSPTGGDSSGLIDDVRQSLAQQRDRMTQAQPVYDALIRQAMGTTPTRYRAGAQPTNGGAGYAYTPPTFGGR